MWVWSKCFFFRRVYIYVCFSIFNIARIGVFIKHINSACTNSIIMWHFHGCCLVQSTDGGTSKLYWTDVTWLRPDYVLHLDKTEKKSFVLYRNACGAYVINRLYIFHCVSRIITCCWKVTLYLTNSFARTILFWRWTFVSAIPCASKKSLLLP